MDRESRLFPFYDCTMKLANCSEPSILIILKQLVPDEIEIEEYYPTFLDMVKNVLDGNMESTAFEDTLREMFGIHAYIAFTLDKVVSYAVRQVSVGNK